MREFATKVILVLMRNLGPMFVATSTATVLMLVGSTALVLGLVLVAVGIPIAWLAWLAWSGAAVTLVAFAARYLFTQMVRSALDRMSEEGVTTIYKTGRTTVLQGAVHLVIFAVYLFTTIVP